MGHECRVTQLLVILLIQAVAGISVSDPSKCRDDNEEWAQISPHLTKDPTLRTCKAAIPYLQNYGLACNSPLFGEISDIKTISDVCTQSCTMCDLTCPENSSANPDGAIGCICDQGFVGTLTWTGLKYEGVCQTVECPIHSSGHPECECNQGYNGTIVWVRDHGGGQFLGECAPMNCDKGFRLEGGICLRVECPENSIDHPNCTCKDGYGGEIKWIIDRYWGQCAECSEGYRSPDGMTNCERASCPPHSSGFPHCTCDAGYAGKVTWQRDDAAFEGECEKCPFGEAPNADGDCEEVPCPPMSSGYPDCACDAGYVGYVSWNVDHFEGVCVVPGSGCPRGTSLVNADGLCSPISCPEHSLGHPDCECGQGHKGLIRWSGIAYDGVCEVEKCPSHSSGFPFCTCDHGYFGNIKWNPKHGEWDGYCEEMPCPLHSSAHPNCRCDVGYVGSIWWRGDAYAGECTAIKCPENSQNHPNCQCFDHLAGDIVWENDHWVGVCVPPSASPSASPPPSPFPSSSPEPSESVSPSPSPSQTKPPLRCKVGFFRDETNSFCERQECPDNSSGHPRCQCESGYSGHIGWTGSRFNGVCQRCSFGSRSVQNNTLCEPVSCPKNAINHPNCTCSGLTAGKVVWNSKAQKYNGSCEECAKGYVPDGSHSNCKVVNCPENAISHPDCVCRYGYMGNIIWSGSNFLNHCVDIRPTVLTGALELVDNIYSENWIDLHGYGFSLALSNILQIDMKYITITSVSPVTDVVLEAQALLQSTTHNTMGNQANSGVIVKYAINVEHIRETLAPILLVTRLTTAINNGGLVHEFDLVEIRTLLVREADHLSPISPGDIHWQPIDPAIASSTHNPYSAYHNQALRYSSILRGILNSSISEEEKRQVIISTLLENDHDDHELKVYVESLTTAELEESLRRIIAATAQLESPHKERYEDGVRRIIQPEDDTYSEVASLLLRVQPSPLWSNFNTDLTSDAIADTLQIDPRAVEVVDLIGLATENIIVKFKVQMSYVRMIGKSVDSTLAALNHRIQDYNAITLRLTDHSVEFDEVLSPLPRINVSQSFDSSVLKAPEEAIPVIVSFATASIIIPPTSKALNASFVQAHVHQVTTALASAVSVSPKDLIITSIKPNIIVSFAVNMTFYDISSLDSSLQNSVKTTLASELQSILGLSVPYVSLEQSLTPQRPEYVPIVYLVDQSSKHAK